MIRTTCTRCQNPMTVTGMSRDAVPTYPVGNMMQYVPGPPRTGYRCDLCGCEIEIESIDDLAAAHGKTEMHATPLTHNAP